MVGWGLVLRCCFKKPHGSQLPPQGYTPSGLLVSERTPVLPLQPHSEASGVLCSRLLSGWIHGTGGDEGQTPSPPPSSCYCVKDWQIQDENTQGLPGLVGLHTFSLSRCMVPKRMICFCSSSSMVHTIAVGPACHASVLAVDNARGQLDPGQAGLLLSSQCRLAGGRAAQRLCRLTIPGRSAPCAPFPLSLRGLAF